MTLWVKWTVGATWVSILDWPNFLAGCKHGKVDSSCSGLSASDPKLYTNFEIHEIEIHKHLKAYESIKPSNLCSQKNNFKQCIFTVEDGASGEQVGDVEKIIVKNLFKI